MKHTIRYLAFSTFIAAALVVPSFTQSLPHGDWHLISYNFKEKVAFPIDKNVVTLKIRTDGKIGGNSGCNAYGGSYLLKNEKLRFYGIISTMRACSEPTPEFENAFYATL